MTYPSSYSYYYPLTHELLKKCASAGNYNRCQQQKQSQQPTWSPKIDVYSDPSTVTIYAELPGLKKDQINIDIKEHILTITGEKSRFVNPVQVPVHVPVSESQQQPSSPQSEVLGEFTSIPSENDNNNESIDEQSKSASTSSTTPSTPSTPKTDTINSEISFGKFSRQFRLGDDVDVQSATAKHQDGVLLITFQRTQPQTWKVNIQ
ncbi:hypothetical protein SAMD00019534_116800 [Acytostelium subglobosum LB1]|uniref:hypothetical protein n=1 Tax=Acytostelium subglobosum LB1 TaxID=1410327 RepID=UPI000644C3E2|nr:hypothetical protein SAMD00019534_116800 [Acytostelium subglobosum LB1]GAM28504.1 hypothetical protein SAMD00019534_116800 [Acytostelium subglobosum LB1]|eukprot:XP_012748543.1 hypothetical protein SAMD00019534_116800 [Acytostelium subglobosum LB1]